MNRNYYNASGYSDPTAYMATQNDRRNRARARRLIREINDLIKQYGFTRLNRIEIKDNKSGAIFK